MWHSMGCYRLGQGQTCVSDTPGARGVWLCPSHHIAFLGSGWHLSACWGCGGRRPPGDHISSRGRVGAWHHCIGSPANFAGDAGTFCKQQQQYHIKCRCGKLDCKAGLVSWGGWDSLWALMLAEFKGAPSCWDFLLCWKGVVPKAASFCLDPSALVVGSSTRPHRPQAYPFTSPSMQPLHWSMPCMGRMFQSQGSPLAKGKLLVQQRDCSSNFTGANPSGPGKAHEGDRLGAVRTYSQTREQMFL